MHVNGFTFKSNSVVLEPITFLPGSMVFE